MSSRHAPAGAQILTKEMHALHIRRGPLVALAVLLPVVILCGCMPSGAMNNPGWTVVTAEAEVVYAAMATGQVVALDASSGSERWVYPVSQPAPGGIGCSIARPPSDSSDRPLDAVYGAPVATGDLLLVASFDRRLYAFDRASGLKEWDTGDEAATDAVIGGVSVFDGIAYFGSSDHKVYAWDIGARKPVWDQPFTTGNWVWGAPSVDDERVYVGSMDHSVYAIDRLTGAEVWRQDVGGSIPGTTTLADGLLLVGSVDKRLHALDAADGSEIWQSQEFGGWVWGGGVVHQGRVYFASLDGQLHGLRISDGSPVWAAPVTVDGAVGAGLALLDGRLVLGTDSGHVYEFDLETGEGKRRFQVQGSILSTPSVAGGTVFVGTTAGKVYALDFMRPGDPDVWVYPPDKK